jgi:hypothetical protein
MWRFAAPLILAGCLVSTPEHVLTPAADMASTDGAQLGQAVDDMSSVPTSDDMSSAPSVDMTQPPIADLATADLMPSCSGTWVRVAYVDPATSTQKHKIICAPSVPTGTGMQGEPCATVTDSSSGDTYGGGCIVGSGLADCVAGTCQ